MAEVATLKTLKIPESLHTDIKLAATARRESVMDMVVRALRRELSRGKK